MSGDSLLVLGVMYLLIVVFGPDVVRWVGKRKAARSLRKDWLDSAEIAKQRAEWCVNTGRVANRELRRMPFGSAFAWCCVLARFRGDWAQAFRGYMASIQERNA